MQVETLKRMLERRGTGRRRANPLWLLAVLSLLIGPGLGQAQAPGQGAGKSAVPPPPKKADGSAPAGGAAPPAAPAQPGQGSTQRPAEPAKAAPAAAAQGPITSDDDPRVKAALARAAAWLKGRGSSHMTGELSLMIHALAKIRQKYPDIVPENDPMLQRMVDALRAHCQGGVFSPTRSGGHANYEAGVAACAFAAVDGQLYKPELEAITQYIIAKQTANGSWDYPGGQNGDTSQTQYAILGLWEAADGAGVVVPKPVWDKAAQWLVTHQNSNGGFAYHPHAPGPGVNQPDPTHTMTCGSLGSLYICRDHLPGGKRKSTRGLLLQVQDEEEKQKADAFKASVTPDQLKNSIDQATGWLTAHFTLEKPTGEGDAGGGRFHLYFLYALERFATLAGVQQFGGLDWYAKGAEILLAKQEKEGEWRLGDGNEVQTSFAVLFLVRSTKRSIIKHEKRLGRGTLVSGKGLPANLAELDLVGGQLKQRAIKGKTGDLLTIIEQGTGDAEGAARGLLQEMYTKKWSAAGAEGDKLRKMLQDGIEKKKSEQIKVVLRLLAVTGDYRVAPLLIDAMYYEEDDEVQLSAREALCLLSRTFPGKYTGSTVEDWQKEIDRWKAWYKSVRPEAELEDEIEIK